MSSVNIGNDHALSVCCYNRNNIWCAMMLSLENRIGNHRVKSLLNLWMGHKCIYQSFKPNYTRPLPTLHDLQGQTFLCSSNIGWCITTRINDMKMSCELRTMFLIMEWYRTCCFHTWLHPMLHSQVCGNSSRNR